MVLEVPVVFSGFTSGYLFIFFIFYKLKNEMTKLGKYTLEF